MKKRILLLTISVLLGLLSRATGFTVNGVAYTITDAANKTVSVGDGLSPAIDVSTSGAFTIPGQVSNGTETYTVTSIGVYCFYSCNGLTSVTISNSVTSIGDYAFYHCQGLTSVTIPNSVTSIGEYAFSFCQGLTSITIPNSVTYIGNRAFYFCLGLTSFNVDSNNPNYDSADGVLFNKNRTTLIQYPFGNTNASYTIPNSVTSIGNEAFSNCTRFNIHYHPQFGNFNWKCGFFKLYWFNIHYNPQFGNFNWGCGFFTLYWFNIRYNLQFGNSY